MPDSQREIPTEDRRPADDWADGWGSWATLTETFLWIVGILLLLVVAGSQLDAHLYQSRSQALLEEELPPETKRTRSAPAEAASHREVPENGEPLGFLEAPRLDLSVVVAEGTGENVLRRAVGRLPESSLPGAPGNLAIAGHRDTHFRSLEQIRRGDELIFRAPGVATQRYVVEWTRVVEPEETWVADPTLEPALTLITCYPFRYVGTAPQRFVVRARRMATAPDSEGSAPLGPGSQGGRRANESPPKGVE